MDFVVLPCLMHTYVGFKYNTHPHSNCERELDNLATHYPGLWYHDKLLFVPKLKLLKNYEFNHWTIILAPENLAGVQRVGSVPWDS